MFEEEFFLSVHSKLQLVWIRVMDGFPPAMMKFSTNHENNFIQGRDVNGMLRLISPKSTKDRSIQEWRLLVLNRVITLLNGIITWVTGVKTPLLGAITSFMTGRGPPCRTVMLFLFVGCLFGQYYHATFFHIRFHM